MHSSFNDQARALGASRYGRRMYELMADYWPTATPSGRDRCAMLEFARGYLEPMPKIVFSTSLDRVDHNAVSCRATWAWMPFTNCGRSGQEQLSRDSPD